MTTDSISKKSFHSGRGIHIKRDSMNFILSRLSVRGLNCTCKMNASQCRFNCQLFQLLRTIPMIPHLACILVLPSSTVSNQQPIEMNNVTFRLLSWAIDSDWIREVIWDCVMFLLLPLSYPMRTIACPDYLCPCMSV